MTEQDRETLVGRLRGTYIIPVNDGAGPLNGQTTFTRTFDASPIHREAADEIERLTSALSTARTEAIEEAATACPVQVDYNRDDDVCFINWGGETDHGDEVSPGVILRYSPDGKRVHGVTLYDVKRLRALAVPK
jgi:hypothetical protein